MKKRRDIEVFSLSFLDCICCGFGAVILLFVLSKQAEPVVLERQSEDLTKVIEKLEEELFELRGTTRTLNRELTAKKEVLSETTNRVARLQGDFSDVQGEFKGSKDNATVQNTIESKLTSALQELTEEMQRLLASQPKKNTSVGGIPVDSEYIIFIIDTSGSMYNYAWPLVIQKIRETLEIYPEVKGIQVMNDMGQYMFSQYRGKWIPDTPARRNAIVTRLRTWNPFSNSSPVEGIGAAIQTYYQPGRKISLYVFGDEFTGPSIDTVVKTVDKINKEDAEGNRLVRIHAVGFPVQFSRPDGIFVTGERFSTLMRLLCHKNGGAYPASIWDLVLFSPSAMAM